MIRKVWGQAPNLRFYFYHHTLNPMASHWLFAISLRFDIPIFTFYQIDKNGEFLTLSTYPEQLEYFYAEKLYGDNPYMSDPDLFRTGCFELERTSDPAVGLSQLMQETISI